MFNELSRSAIGFAQEQDEYAAKNDARQAWVTRPEGSGVWVRFGGESATALESWFPSTHAGLPAGFMGWVYPLGGGKGFFVAAGVTRNKPLGNRAVVSISVSTSANVTIPSAGVLFTGLVPGRTYEIDATAEMVAGSSGVMFITFEAGGATNVRPPVSKRYTLTGLYTGMESSGVISVVANANGEISVAPVYAWSSGSFTISWAGITARIS